MKKMVKSIVISFLFIFLLQCGKVNAATFDALTKDDYCNGAMDEEIMSDIYKTAGSSVRNGVQYFTFNIPQRYFIAIQGASSGQYYNKGTVSLKYDDIKNKQIQIYESQNGCAVGYIKRGTKCTEQDYGIASPQETRNYNNGTSTITVSTPKNVVAIVYKISDNASQPLKNVSENSKTSVSVSVRNTSTETIYIDYYATSGSCQGSYIKTTEVSVTGYSRNNQKNSTYCNRIKNTAFYKSYPDYFTVCNSDYVDYGTEYSEEDLEGLYNVIIELGNIKAEYGNKALKGLKATEGVRGNEPLYCKFDKSENVSQEKEYVTVEKTEYYTKVCRETVQIDFDTPKLVSNNGGGFTYDVHVKPTVSCYVSLNEDYLKKLFELTVQQACNIKGSCYGTYDHGEFDAGPSEDFDACVNTCDGGEYTQSCINSCYSKVYEQNSVSNTNNLLNRNTSNGLLNIRYTGKYEDQYSQWSNGWCSAPPRSGSGRATNNSTHGYYVANHYNPGTYQCAHYYFQGQRVNLKKYFRTYNCDSNCSVTISGNGKSVTKKLDDDGTITSLKVNSDGMVTEGGVNCYIRKSGNKITINTSAISDLKEIMESVGEEVEEMNEKGADYSKADYTYTIHDSTASYCDNSNKNFVTYKKNALSVDDNHITTNSNKTISSNSISMGFANVCLKDGETNKGSGSNGCCTASDGISGGKKFYMAVTTENDINSVYSWPTTSNANFTDAEKETINNIRKDIENKTTGNVIVYDAKTFANENTEEACDANGRKFNYNIKVSLDNLGVLGDSNNKWSFDINCFYGYYNPNLGSCGVNMDNVDTDGDGELDTTVIKETLCNDGDSSGDSNSTSEATTTLVDNYIFRTVDVSNLFNNAEVRPWSWQTSKTTQAATSLLKARGITYNIDPDTLVDNIQNTGYAYTDYRNFQFIISSTNMRNIRNYNSKENQILSKLSCDEKSSGLGCDNQFIENNTYSGDHDIVEGTFNNIRDRK